MTGKINVEMIFVIAVVVGPKNGGESVARAVVHGAQKRALLFSAVPTALDSDDFTARQREARDVERVGIAMF